AGHEALSIDGSALCRTGLSRRCARAGRVSLPAPGGRSGALATIINEISFAPGATAPDTLPRCGIWSGEALARKLLRRGRGGTNFSGLAGVADGLGERSTCRTHYSRAIGQRATGLLP